MQALAAHSRRRRRRWPLILAAVVVLGAAVAGIATVPCTQRASAGRGGRRRQGQGRPGATAQQRHRRRRRGPGRFTVVATTPQTGSAGVASNATVERALLLVPWPPAGPIPTLNPPVAGHWTDRPATPWSSMPRLRWYPASTETVTVPEGRSGVRDAVRRAPGPQRDGDVHRGRREYPPSPGATGPAGLPAARLRPPTPAPAADRHGRAPAWSLTWRWTMPTSLTSLWLTGSPNVITKAAVMSFERQNGLTVDGVAGPRSGRRCWATWPRAREGTPHRIPTCTSRRHAARDAHALCQRRREVRRSPGQHRRPWCDNAGRHVPGLRAREGLGHEGHQHHRVHLQRPHSAVGELLQRRGRSSRVRALPLRLPPEQRLRRDADHRCRNGLAVHADRHPGDGGGLCPTHHPRPRPRRPPRLRRRPPPPRPLLRPPHRHRPPRPPRRPHPPPDDACWARSVW